MTTRQTHIDVLQVASMLAKPQLTPAALPALPTITNDWDSFGSNEPATVIKVTTNTLSSSAIAGLNPGIVGSAARGTIRILINMGGDNAQNSGNLFLMQDTPGNTWPFHLAGRRPYVCVPSLAMCMIRLDETDKWHVISVAGVEDMIRSIAPATIDPGTTLTNWDPVDATTGLSFRFCNHMFIQPTGINVELTSMAINSGIGSSPPGSSYGQRFSMTNAGTSFTIVNAGAAGGGATFRCPGGSDFIVPNLGTAWFWYDANNNVIWVESCRIGGQ